MVLNYKGEKYNLQEYVDPEQAFITSKTIWADRLRIGVARVVEWPMAKWITLFVEVPIITFNPVKVVNDLLKKTHQG